MSDLLGTVSQLNHSLTADDTYRKPCLGCDESAAAGDLLAVCHPKTGRMIGGVHPGRCLRTYYDNS